MSLEVEKEKKDAKTGLEIKKHVYQNTSWRQYCHSKVSDSLCCTHSY